MENPMIEPVKPQKETKSQRRARKMIDPVKDAIVSRFCFSPAKPDVCQLRVDFEVPAFGVTSVLLENLFERVTEIERRGPAKAATSTSRPFLISKWGVA